VNRSSPVQPVDGRSVVSTGVGITLVVAGAILRFAVTATFAHVLNAHVAGVIVMLVGVFALLLSLLVWGPLNRRRGHSGDNGGSAAASPAAERLPNASRPRDQESALAGRPGSARLPRQRPERDRYHVRSAHRVQ
jgi:hypothetical protein